MGLLELHSATERNALRLREFNSAARSTGLGGFIVVVVNWFGTKKLFHTSGAATNHPNCNQRKHSACLKPRPKSPPS